MKTFVYVAGSAAKKQCSGGSSAACKLAYLVDPAYKDKKELNQKLDQINDELKKIEGLITEVLTQLNKLEDELKIGIAQLELDINNSATMDLVAPIEGAYDHLQDFQQTQNPLTYVKSALTNAPSSNPWDVPNQLELMHYRITDPDSGLLFSLDGLIKAKLEAGGAPVDSYEMLEQYFGHLLAVQSKGLVVVATCYNYLDQAPDKETSDTLIHKTLPDYLKGEYQPHVEKQVQLFLRSAELLISRAADPHKPGTTMEPWAATILRRADLTAAWARAALEDAVNGPTGTRSLLVARVVGEPDRVDLLRKNGGLRDTPAGKGYVVDKTCQGPDYVSAECRAWKANAPYVQFPVHPELPEGDIQREGAIKGAASFSMMKHTLAGIALKEEDRGLTAPGASSWLPDSTVTVTQVGPDGNAPEPDGPAMFFGHGTLVLKAHAAERGMWSTDGPYQVEYKIDIADDDWNLVGKAGTSYPQWVQVYLYAKPKTWSDKHCAPTGDCWTDYYIKGYAHVFHRIRGEYHFEGWGDVEQPVLIDMTLSGKVSGGVTHNADHGSHVESVHFYQQGTGGFHVEKNVSLDTAITLQGGPTAKLAPGSTVQIDVHAREKVSWDSHRQSKSFGSCPFQGWVRFDLTELELKPR